jgi:hypothetical protein
MAITRVQGTFHENGSSTSTTVAVTLAAAVGNGNLVCVSIGFAAATSGENITQVTDDKSNVYTIVDGIYHATGGYRWTTAFCANVTNAPITITATLSNSRAFAAILVDEFSGVATASPTDGHAANTAAASGGTLSAMPTIVTTTNGDLVFGAGVNIDSVSITVGTNLAWIAAQSNIDSSFCTEYLVQTTAGSIACDFHVGGSSNIAAVMAFKAATVATKAMPVFQRRRKLWIPGGF